MKCLKKIIAGCLALGMVACSSDDEIAGGADNNAGVAGQGGEVYATLTLNLPTKRAGEANPVGVEFGQNYENKVGSVLIVLAEVNEADNSYTYVTSSLSDGALNPGTGTSASNNPVYTVTFENDALKAYAGQELAVFAYANPTQELRTAIGNLNAKDSFTDLVAHLTESDEIWTNNAFFMTSVGKIVSFELDADIATSTSHNTPESAIKLGTVPVERVAARFDYKQVNGNIYPITTSVPDEQGEAKTVTVGNVVLDDMALINMATEYYFLPRTSADGKNEGISLCPGANGMEQNWVVSPRFKEYLDFALNQNQLPDGYFRYPMNNSGNWNWTAIASLGDNDNDDSWNSEESYGDYKIWRYAVENTIPQAAEGDYSSQKKGLTTGVVFKGHIDVTDEESPLYRAFNAGEPIYMFNEVIYGGVAELAKAVEASPVSSLAESFNAAFTKVENTVDGEVQVSYEEKAGVKMGELGFTVYRKTGNEYPIYYYYYNRHNNNDMNNVMGAMEFGVVRNNVYKLSVTNINRFGHPSTDPNDPDDPDPEDPDDPDEDNKIYFKVDVEVLPWVVRVNNIEF